jgi:hypothetical protein
MDKTIKILSGIVGVLVVVVVYLLIQLNTGATLGGADLIVVKQNFKNGFQVNGTDAWTQGGNVTVPGTLAVTGESTFTGAATFSGAVSGIPTLSVTGTSTLGVVTSSGKFYLNNWATFESLATFNGTAAFNGQVGFSGLFSTALLNVSNTSSTVQIGNTSSGVGTGCLVLGDSGGATSTPVYITATGATITATTTKPAICR